MSRMTNAILVRLRVLTLLEAVELVSHIEKTFRVDTSTSTIEIITMSKKSREAHSKA